MYMDNSKITEEKLLKPVSGMLMLFVSLFILIGGIVFFAVVLVVRFCVELVGYGQDYADASDVNERLRQRREERSGTRED